MPEIDLQNIGNFFGVQLAKDAYFAARLDQVEDLGTTSIIDISLSRLVYTEIYSVYELVGGVLTLQPEVKILPTKLTFESVPTGNIILFPKKALTVAKNAAGASVPTEIFIKPMPNFVAKNIQVTSYDFETAAEGSYEFAATKAGTYSISLGLAASAVSFWVRSTQATVGEITTVPLSLTMDLYL